MVKIKNKNKVVVVINNNASKKRVTRRRTNPLSKSQETIVRHHYFNTPIFNPIVPNHAPVGTRVSDYDKEREIAQIKHDTERNHKHIQNLANRFQERDDEISFKTPDKSTVKFNRHEPDITVKDHPKITNYFKGN